MRVLLAIVMLLAVAAASAQTLRIEGEGASAPWVGFTHDGTPGWFRGDFTFDGTAWTLWGWAPVGNPAPAP